MRSNLNTIKPKLYELFPNIDPVVIDEVIEIYFEQANKAIKTFQKPEISLLWGTLILGKGRAYGEIQMLKTLLKNRDTPINTLTDEQLEKKKIKLERIETAYQIYKEVKEKGKTKRNKKRKEK